MIEGFFFGAEGEEIFATYHPPSYGTDKLTIICPALFSEYMRTQLAWRELAISLAEAGHHVLRFDFRGQGDSSGTFGQMTISDWVADAKAVVDEGRELTGVENVALLGARFGASVASCAAETMPQAVTKLVLWDPIINGRTYLESLRQIQSRMLQRNRYLDRPLREAAALEVAGQSVDSQFLKSIDDFDLASSCPWALKNGVAIVSDGADVPPMSKERIVPVRFDCGWTTDSEDIMVPQPLLERLHRCLV